MAVRALDHPLNKAASAILESHGCMDMGYLPVLNLLWYCEGELADVETLQCFLERLPGSDDAAGRWLINNLDVLDADVLLKEMSVFIEPEELEGVSLEEAAHLVGTALVAALNSGELRTG